MLQVTLVFQTAAMMSTAFSRQLVSRMRALDQAKRELQTISAEALGASKRAIFAFHREDREGGRGQLEEARRGLERGWKIVKKQPRIIHEGSWRAAQEEFVEADLFAQYLESGKIGQVHGVSEDPDIFLGGLSDLTGELVRRAVSLATRRETKTIERIFEDVSVVIELLLKMDLTGSLRTKVDQAKQNLRKLEEIRYDLTLRGSACHD